MKVLSNKKYDMLIIENESLKEIRENDNLCIDMLGDKIKELEEENRKLKEKMSNDNTIIADLVNENKKLKEELGKITVHSNMLESENKLLKEECKARLEKIKELEK